MADPSPTPDDETPPEHRKSLRTKLELAVPDLVFRLPRWTRFVIPLLIGAVVSLVIVAVFGNLATDELHSVVWPWLSAPAVVAHGTFLLFGLIVLVSVIYFNLSISRGSSVQRLTRELRVQSDKTADVSRQVGRLEEQLQRSVEVSEVMQEKCLSAEACRISLSHEILESFPQIPSERYVAWWTRLVESVLEALCNEVFTGADFVEHGSVLLPRSDSDYLSMSVGSRVASESLRGRRFYCGHDERFMSQRGVTGTAFAERRPVYEGDVERSELHVPLDGHRASYKSLLATPLARNEAPPLGVISIGSRDELTQPALDAHLLQGVSSVLATALRLLHEKGVTNEQLIVQDA